jgi:alkylation response protein AidB-like acyl-CoA dehydrogenase
VSGETMRRNGRPDEWLERARALAPIIEQWRDEGENQRRLPTPAFEAMRDFALFDMFKPKRYGGHELDQQTCVRVVEEVSRQDGAAGWNLAIGGGASRLAYYFSEAAAAEIFTEGLLAGSFAPTGQATPVPGGHRLTGRWSFASGCHQANWIGAGATIMEDDRPKMLTEGRPEIMLFFLPSAECQILDTWYTAGLRGTGSHDFEANDIFIPHGREFPFDNLFRLPANPLIEYSFLEFGIPVLAAVGLGIARAAVDTFMAMVAEKKPRGGTSTLLTYHTVHEKVGRAEASLGAARAYLFEAVRLVASGKNTADCRGEDRLALVRLAGTYAAEISAEVATLMFRAGGGTAVYATNRLERCFRDANMVTQHMQLQPTNYEMVGQYFLGLGLQMRR